MTKRFFQVFVALAVVALFVVGQQAFAAEVPHNLPTIRVVHNGGGNTDSVIRNVAPAVGLYGISQQFAATGGPWPCFGGGSCSDTDGGSVEVGVPQYAWLLTGTAFDQLFDCNANTTAKGTQYCAETETWYEDFSVDTSDDLAYILTAVQGTSTILNSGTQDFGPNALGIPSLADYPFEVIFSGPTNFGTYGQAGPYNGACSNDYQYPLPGPASGHNPIVYPYVIRTNNKTCLTPVSGVTKLTSITELATPSYTHSTSGTVCFGFSGPPFSCWTTKLTVKYKATQTWNIWLQ